MFHKRHRIVVFARAHSLDAGTERGNGQDDDIAHPLRRLDAGEVLPGDVALAGRHIEVVLVVEVIEDGIGPDSRPGELHDRLLLGRGVGAERAFALHLQRVLGDLGDDLAQHGMPRFGLDGPLAELDAARVPVVPVRSIGVGFDADDEAVRGARHLGRHPVHGGFERRRVDVRVDAAAGEQDQVAEEIGFEHRLREGIVGFEHVGDRGVEMADEVHGDGVGDDFVHKVGV